MRKIKYNIRMITVILAVVCVSIILMPNVFAQKSNVKLFVIDKMLNADTVEANGIAMVAVRPYLESLGFNVEWVESSQSVRAGKDGSFIELAVNSNVLVKDGTAIAMSCAVIQQDDITYAPARSIAEAMGYTVEWFNSANVAVITDGSCSYTFYNNTPALMPTVESVMGTSVIPESNWLAEDVGVYYKYKGLTEEDAMKYCSVLADCFDFKYDSMQLTQSYSKLYVYVCDRTTAIVEVSSDGISVYPSVRSSYAYEPVKDDETSQIPQNDVLYDEQTPPQPENGENSVADDTVYYENTAVPDYSYITGASLAKKAQTEKGNDVYVYQGSMIDAARYMSALTAYYGFSNYSMDTSPFEMTITYSAQKGSEFVIAMYSMMSDYVYITYGVNE